MFDVILFIDKQRSGQMRQSLLGLNLFTRVIRRLEQSGAKRIVLVGDAVGAQLGDLGIDAELKTEISVSREIPGFQLIAPKAEAVLFWNAELLADKALPCELIQRATEKGECIAAYDSNHGSSQHPPVALAIPCNVMEGLEGLEHVRDLSGLTTTLESRNIALRTMENRGESRPGFALLPSSKPKRREAEKALLNELRKPMEVDGFLGALVYRIFSLPMSRMLAPFPITPNHITAVALILGLTGAGAMASGTPTGFLIGAILLQLGAIIDCVDGELARLKYLGSLDGAWFDTVADDIVNNSFILGAGVGLARLHNTAWPLALSIAAVLLILPGLSFLYRGLVQQGSGDLCDFDWRSEEKTDEIRKEGLGARIQDSVKYLVKRDVYVTLFLVAVLMNIPEFIPIAGFIGALGFALTVSREIRFRQNHPDGEAITIPTSYGQEAIS